MFLLVLDKDGTKSALKVPQQLRHKQLLELMQMVSCIVDFGYKQLSAGKELKQWIEKNPFWTWQFACELKNSTNLSMETSIKYQCLINLLYLKAEILKGNHFVPTTAIFRYSKDYECDIPTNTELPIEECISEYQKYIKWKQDNKVRGY